MLVFRTHKKPAINIMTKVMAASDMKMNPCFEKKINGSPFKGREEMCYESMRLQTFKNWPTSGSVWPTSLAKAGFFYTGSTDQVECFCCSSRLNSWKAGDSPMIEHKRYSPQCTFVTGKDTTNVPLGGVSEMLSGSQVCQNSTKSKHYRDQATKAVAGDSRQSKSQLTVAGLDEHAGTASIGHHTTADKGLRHHASVHYSASSCASISGHSRVTGGASGKFMLTVEQQQKMKLESKRLESFTDWPSSANVRPEQLARAGVYYLGVEDRVKCAFCNGIIQNWQSTDDPMEVHGRRFPKCVFVRDAQAAGNMSIEEEKVNTLQASQNAVANPFPSLGVVTSDEPRSLNYSGETSRLLSFRRWPENSSQAANDLAQAGFYYMGIEESVKCFSCNGTLHTWGQGDDPWTEHARWFPCCNYLRTVKGEAFIRTVQASHSGQTNSTRTAYSTAGMTQSANTEECRFPVEPRMVRARMDTTRVRSILDMGFTRDLLYQVIEHHLKTTGDDFPNVQSLMEAVFAAEEAFSSSSHSSQTPQEMSATTSDPAAVTASAAGSSGATAAACNGAGTAATEDQTAASENSSPKSKRKNKKRKKKNKSNNEDNKTSVSASESSSAPELKTEENVTTTTDQRLQCKICLDNEVTILFLPCAHLCSCAKCAPSLRKCAICRTLIRGTVRVYV